MYNLIRLVVWVFLLLVFVASIGFSFLNPTPVSLSFGVLTLSPQPVALWVVSAFSIGGLLGLMIGAGLGGSSKSKNQNRRLREQLDRVHRQLIENSRQVSGDLE